jgi:exodeoxyribonuclease VII large subunit
VQLLQQLRQQLQHRLDVLQALSPQRLLERGFALVRHEDGRLLRSVAQVREGERLQLRLADGRIDTVVQQISPTSHD